MSKKRTPHRPSREQPPEAPAELDPGAPEAEAPAASAGPAPEVPESAQGADQPQTDGPALPESESGPGEPPEVASLRRKVEELEAELDAACDRALRFQAELDNYRKRAAREIESERRYAALPLMRDLLSVLDNIHRAIDAGREATGKASGHATNVTTGKATSKPTGVEALLEGFKMVARQLEDVLRRHDCVRIEALHSPFDPNFHEAVLQQPSREHPPNTVLQVTQQGFQLHDRVVRPSRVVVSVPSESE